MGLRDETSGLVERRAVCASEVMLKIAPGELASTPNATCKGKHFLPFHWPSWGTRQQGQVLRPLDPLQNPVCLGPCSLPPKQVTPLCGCTRKMFQSPQCATGVPHLTWTLDPLQGSGGECQGNTRSSITRTGSSINWENSATLNHRLHYRPYYFTHGGSASVTK